MIDNIFKEIGYAVHSFVIIALLRLLWDCDNKSNLKYSVEAVYALAFAGFRISNDISNPLIFSDRIESFTAAPMYIFFVVFILLFLFHVWRAGFSRPDYYANRFTVYLLTFLIYIAGWCIIFAIESLPAFIPIQLTALDMILPFANANLFAIWLIMLHDNEVKGSTLYRAPGVGDDDENPFEFDDSPVDLSSQHTTFGALNLI
jgi:hypothetical protein